MSTRVLIIISVIIAAITLYFLFRDANSHKVIGILPSDSSDSSNTTPVIHPIIDLHNLPGSIVTASSYQGERVPEKGRKNSDDYWQPADNDDDPWIQFTFPDRYEFTSVDIFTDRLYETIGFDILFARDDDGKFWEEPIRILYSNHTSRMISPTINPTVKSKIIRIKSLKIKYNTSTSNNIIPIKVGLHGRELK